MNCQNHQNQSYDSICLSKDQCIQRRMCKDCTHFHKLDNSKSNYQDFKTLIHEKLLEYKSCELSKNQIFYIDEIIAKLNEFSFYQKNLRKQHQNFKDLIGKERAEDNFSLYTQNKADKLVRFCQFVEINQNQQIVNQVQQLLQCLQTQDVDDLAKSQVLKEEKEENPKIIVSSSDKNQPNELSRNTIEQQQAINDQLTLIDQNQPQQQVAQLTLLKYELPPKTSNTEVEMVKIERNSARKQREKANTIDEQHLVKKIQKFTQKHSRKVRILTKENSVSQIYAYIQKQSAEKLYQFLNENKYHFDLTDEPISKVKYTAKKGIMFRQGNQFYGYRIDSCHKYRLGFFNDERFLNGQLIRTETCKQDKMEALYFIIIEGEFYNGFAQKNIKMYRSDGEVYEGETRKNKMHGQGKYEGFLQNDQGIRTDVKSRYEGSFMMDHFQVGTWESKDFKYTGQFKASLFDGKGEFENKQTGEIYKGEFKNNLRHGNGELTLRGDYEYRGQFKYDEFDGYGKFTRQKPGNQNDLLPNVKEFEGDFERNMIVPSGTEILFNLNRDQPLNQFDDE